MRIQGVGHQRSYKINIILLLQRGGQVKMRSLEIIVDTPNVEGHMGAQELNSHQQIPISFATLGKKIENSVLAH